MSINEQSKIRVLDSVDINGNINEIAPEDQAALDWCYRTGMIGLFPKGVATLTPAGREHLKMYYRRLAAQQAVTAPEPAKGKAKKSIKPVGAPLKIDEHRQYYDEYHAGLERNYWKNPTEYLKKKHPKYRDNLSGGRSWLKGVFDKVEKDKSS